MESMGYKSTHPHSIHISNAYHLERICFCFCMCMWTISNENRNNSDKLIRFSKAAIKACSPFINIQYCYILYASDRLRIAYGSDGWHGNIQLRQCLLYWFCIGNQSCYNIAEWHSNISSPLIIIIAKSIQIQIGSRCQLKLIKFLLFGNTLEYTQSFQAAYLIHIHSSLRRQWGNCYASDAKNPGNYY